MKHVSNKRLLVTGSRHVALFAESRLLLVLMIRRVSTRSFITINHTARWRGGATGKAFGLAISRSRVQILLEATLRNNLRQVVHTYVPLSPSSITCYRPNVGDALWLGR